MFKNFYKMETSISNNDSALIRCLKSDVANESLFKNWVAKEMNLSADDERVAQRVAFVLEQKNKLNQIKDKTEKEQLLGYVARLISAKFSGKKQSELAISLVLDKLIFSFLNKKPIIFVFGYGGYKNYNSPSFPEVDFSELFHMKYMASYLWPIISTYKYGVEFEYESEEISIQFNNVPQSTTDKYTVSFKKLLNYFSKKLFQQNGKYNVVFKSVIAREMYKPTDLYEKMSSYYDDMKKVLDEISAEEKEIWLKRAKTNFMVCGEKDYSKLSENELNKKIFEARINNECFLAADYDLRVDFWERPNAISLFGTWGKTPCASPTDGGLHLKSTAASNTDFWIGTGVFKLDNNGNILQEQILSQKQYDELKDKLKTIKNPDGELAKISKNFEQIIYFN